MAFKLHKKVLNAILSKRLRTFIISSGFPINSAILSAFNRLQEVAPAAPYYMKGRHNKELVPFQPRMIRFIIRCWHSIKKQCGAVNKTSTLC